MPVPLITVGEARRRVLDRVLTPGSETVPVLFALGRVLAADVLARGDTPPFPSSAMDGYAIRSGPAGRRLTVAGESRAGAPSDRGPGPEEAIRISTGATVPEDADAIIPQENVVAADGVIETTVAVRAGEHVRAPGEDMRAGTRVLAAGARLGAIELGATVAAGLGEVTVAPRPHVAVLCTGDELRAPGEPLARARSTTPTRRCWPASPPARAPSPMSPSGSPMTMPPPGPGSAARWIGPGW